jgi:basic membrane protein A and related proteins
MHPFLRLAALAVLVLSSAGSLAVAQSYIAPAVVYTTGGKADKSINESVVRGLRRVAFVTQVQVPEKVPSSEADFVPMLRDFATQDSSPIIAVGALQVAAVTQVAKEFPNLQFALLDAVVDLPNVRSMTFKEQEGAFLVGIAAAMASKTGKLGFVGGMDTPAIHRFECGFERGARYANPNVQVMVDMIGKTAAAWSDPARGTALANGQMDKGADVVFTVAGASGEGVIQAAKARGKYVVTGMNQARSAPGTVLTAMAKRFDVAVFETVSIAGMGKWKGGRTELGLKDGAVDWMVDDFNENLITPAMKAKVDEAKQLIIEGKLAVPDYTKTNSCPR